jgi:hypothetical protein
MALAGSLKKNHNDQWLTDFLNSPHSSGANQLLKSSMQANRLGENDRAVDEAKAAEALFAKEGNIAGAARSQMEVIYGYRRHSKSKECLTEINRLKQRIHRRRYTNIQIIADFESANCQSMEGNFDRGWRFAKRAIVESDQAHYPSLELRSLTLLSALDSAEGRFQEAFHVDFDGLGLFWQGFYAPERGFQFYSDSSLTAEQKENWHVAALLQREALSMLADTDRFDFQAAAHFHLATSALRISDLNEASRHFNEAYRLFAKMSDRDLANFIKASSEIDLAHVEIQDRNLASAQSHLESAAASMEGTDNFVVKLDFYNAWADLEHLRNRSAEEWQYLEKTIAVVRQGFASLSSVTDRWKWYREVDHSYHRLVELELEMNHDPVQALADWEDYRAAETGRANIAPGSNRSRERLASRLAELRSGTLVSLAVFPHSVNIWVADNRGVSTFNVKVESAVLKQETEQFFRLCSDPSSSLEKVNLVGSRLYERLFAPIEPALAPDRVLEIDADGFLSRIPWPALVGQKGEYLGQKYMTQSTPGLLFTTSGQSQTSSTHNTLVAYPGGVEFRGKAYPPLPHAKEEADYVAAHYPGSVYLQNEGVTRTALIRSAASISVGSNLWFFRLAQLLTPIWTSIEVPTAWWKQFWELALGA